LKPKGRTGGFQDIIYYRNPPPLNFNSNTRTIFESDLEVKSRNIIQKFIIHYTNIFII
jgi:hypothetical protein